ncbi:hypothetical protein Tco_0723137, partial [Tanacetum coccineum]
MPIALKANITRSQTSNDSISQDKCDEDEEINLMAKNFIKIFRKGVKKHDKFDICKENTKGGSSRREHGCYNFGDKNHFIDDCPKSKRNKAFVRGAWSDSEDGNEPQNDATCLMAFDSQELEMKKLAKSKEVVEPCENYDVLTKDVDSLKSNISKLQDEALNFSKFKKSSVALDDVLSRQKLSQDKEGLGFSKNDKTTSESLNVTFDESLPKSRTSSLVDDDLIEEYVVQNYDRTQNLNYDLEEVLPRVENIKEIRDHPIDQMIGELDERTLRKRVLTLDKDSESIDSTKYRGMIGTLLYLTASRLDIMFSVCLCARFQEDPK